jgi:hypothetical protein
VSLHSPGRPPASISGVLGLQLYTKMPSWKFGSIKRKEDKKIFKIRVNMKDVFAKKF